MRYAPDNCVSTAQKWFCLCIVVVVLAYLVSLVVGGILNWCSSGHGDEFLTSE